MKSMTKKISCYYVVIPVIIVVVVMMLVLLLLLFLIVAVIVVIATAIWNSKGRLASCHTHEAIPKAFHALCQSEKMCDACDCRKVMMMNSMRLHRRCCRRCVVSIARVFVCFMQLNSNCSKIVIITQCWYCYWDHLHR